MYSRCDMIYLQVRFAAGGRGSGGLLWVHRTLPAQPAGPAIVGPLLHEAVSERTRWSPAHPVRQKVNTRTHRQSTLLWQSKKQSFFYFIFSGETGMSNTLPDCYRVPSRSIPVRSFWITWPLLEFRPSSPTADAGLSSKYAHY